MKNTFIGWKCFINRKCISSSPKHFEFNLYEKLFHECKDEIRGISFFKTKEEAILYGKKLNLCFIAEVLIHDLKDDEYVLDDSLHRRFTIYYTKYGVTRISEPEFYIENLCSHVFDINFFKIQNKEDEIKMIKYYFDLCLGSYDPILSEFNHNNFDKNILDWLEYTYPEYAFTISET